MRQKIVDLLMSTERGNIDNLIGWMVENGFFESPASTKYHGCYSGGLAKHSLHVYEMLRDMDKALKLQTPIETIIIASLLHDLCKVGAYIGTSKPYAWNRNHPKEHASLSIKIAKMFIELTDLEEKMILYHMGVYGLVEFQNPGQESRGEYTLRNKGMANAWYHHPVVKLMYFCDELATLKEKSEEA